MFVNFDFDNQNREDNFDYNDLKLFGWPLLSQTILNKFQPRHVLFEEQLKKHKEMEEEKQ